jgi:DNA-binding CsgD family transcriptional regulator/tetratricopeptide (TPR) repeat protein
MSPGVSGTLVGRDPELQLLVDLLGVARRGSLAVAVIEGDAGIGKTALLARLADVARERGVVVVRGTAHALESTRPFGPLIDALQLRLDARDERRTAIAQLLSLRAAPGAAPLAAGQLQFQVVEGVIDLLETISDQNPVLLVIDDLHWAENATLLAIEWIMRRLTAVPVMLVVAVRPAPRSPDLARLLDDSARLAATFIRLEPLADRDIEALAQVELGAPLGLSVSAAVQRAGGSPLWVVELLRSLAAEGRIDRSSGVAELRAGDLPGSIRELVIRRLAELPDQAVKALRTASLFGESFSLTEMAAVSGRRVTDLVDDLGPAFTAGLVADHRGVLIFRHELVRDAIYESLPSAARIALHREAADALAAAGAAPDKVAAHLMLGAVPPDPAAATALRDAAATAAPRAPGVAASLLRRAVELLPDDEPGRDGMLLALAECVQRVGDVAGSIQIAQSVLHRPHDEALEIPLRFVVISGLSLQRLGRELIAHTDAVLAHPRASAAEQAHALALACLGRAFSGDLVGGESAARRGLEIAERAGDRSMMSWNLNILGGVLKPQGRYAEAIEATGRAIEIALHPPDLQARRRAPHMMHGMALCDADRFDEAEAAFHIAAEESAAVGVGMLEADIQLLGSEIRLLRGEWDQAVPEIGGGIEFARERGNLITLPRFHGHLAVVAAARGDRAAAEARLASFAAELRAEQPCFGAEFVFYAAAFLAEVAGAPEMALDHLHRFMEHDAEQDNLNGHRFIAPAMTRLAMQLDRPDVARDAATRAEHAAEIGGEVPSVRAAALRCRGLLECDPSLMAEAVALASRSRRALDHAGTCEDAASVLAAHGKTADARHALEPAIECYEALGATWLTARALAAHRSLGGRRGARGPRPRGHSGWERLTRSERAVGELVAEGLTNREIGMRLFISPHTVNSHLRHAFRKLDVSTRAGLAAAVSADRARRALT